MKHIIFSDGNEFWIKGTDYHRQDEEKMDCNTIFHEITSNGSEYWGNHLGFHRGDGGPAYVSFMGDEQWYKDYKMQRDCNSPTIIDVNGEEPHYWYGSYG